MDQKKDSYTLAILVYNRPSVLMRVVALFARRGYNIDSLSVGETESPERSRITIVVTGDRQIVEQIIRQVGKLVDVIKVHEMTRNGSLQRELMLVKLHSDNSTRMEIAGIGEMFKAKILDVTPETVTMQLTGSLDKLESFLQLVRPYGIVELVRTGITALERGSRPISEIASDEEG
ncbi:MAG: acetolactate synthase small subunit [Spirochaetes bacterium]|uniref:Acetolactate synthase small subunit n=1 Tax=Candidatus Ornithospirochaeta stercoravium TaxID=2840897 RepID=A0A9D9ND38_9SPIO|nr:acetolactate synthase small subunit [Candidatus Ornithospirochaeta stercoravium]